MIEKKKKKKEKRKNYFIDLFDDVLDKDNPFNDTMKTEDIFIDDNLFDDNDKKDIKKFLKMSFKI